MGKKEWKATLGFAAAALLLGSCGLSAGDGTGGPFALLGPPDAPVNLYYEEQGKGPPVLLLHGFGASTFTWRHVAPDLAETHRVIAVDLKGFGQSDKPFDERYSVSDQAELLAQLIEDKDLRDLTIVGHSFGGGVALRLALDANAVYFVTQGKEMQQTDGTIQSVPKVGGASKLLLEQVHGPQAIAVDETYLYWAGADAAIHKLTRRVRRRTGSATESQSPRNVYATKDGGWVAISASTQAMTERLFQAIGRGDLNADPKFKTNAERIKRRGLVILCSDLMDRPDEVLSALQHFRHRNHEVIVFHLWDPWERYLPLEGHCRFHDIETGETLVTQAESVRDDYLAAVEQWRDQLEIECRNRAIDRVELTTDDPLDQALLDYLVRRAKAG